MYIGDRGEIFIDDSLLKDKERVLVLRPIIKDKEQYRVYQKCVEDYSELLDKRVRQGEILFDWRMDNSPNSYVCSTFIFHILKKCLPNYKNYFKIKDPDKIHFKNGKPYILFDKALNKKMFKVIIKIN